MVPQVWLFDRLDRGIGNLDPRAVRELVLTRQVNGENALTVTTTQGLEKHTRLVLKDGTGRWHEYVVQGVESTHQDGGAVASTYYCVWSIQHDLSQTYIDNQYGCGVRPGKTSVPHPATDGLACALEGTARWAQGTVDVSTMASASFYRRTGWEGLQTVVERWGGEIDATITVGERGVTARSVDLLTHMGAVQPTRRFDYDADMRSVRRRVLDDQWTCRIVPLGKSVETDAGGYTRRPTIESVNGGVVWLEDAEAVPYCRMDGPDGWEYPVQIVLNDTYEDPSDLKAWAIEHITDYTRPRISYEASVVQLARAGMDPKGVGLGDEVVVVDRTFGEGGLRVTGRVLKIKEDLLDPARTELTISNLTDGMASQLTSLSAQIAGLAEQVESTYQLQESAAYITAIIDRLNQQANSTGGYTYITEGQGIRTYDVPVTNPAVGAEASAVVEIKGGTIRIANTKTQAGVWEWKTVFTSGHIAADLVTALAVTAGTIRSANGDISIDLDNDTISVNGTALSTVISDVDGLNTVIRDSAAGTLVCKEGADFGALVSSSGAFEVVGLTWDAQTGEPTIGGTWLKADDGGIEYVNLDVSGEPRFRFDGDAMEVGYSMGTKLGWSTTDGLRLSHRTGMQPVTDLWVAHDGTIRGGNAYKWRQLATAYGTVAAPFDVSEIIGGEEFACSELLVTVTYSTTFAASVVVPVAALTDTYVDWYLGGWSNGSDYNAACKLKLDGITPYALRVGGSSANGNWTVYGR